MAGLELQARLLMAHQAQQASQLDELQRRHASEFVVLLQGECRSGGAKLELEDRLRRERQEVQDALAALAVDSADNVKTEIQDKEGSASQEAVELEQQAVQDALAQLTRSTT